MPEVWPIDVNQDVLRDPVHEQPEDNVHRFKPDVGPSIDHSRTITAGAVAAFEQWFTVAEYDAMVAWRRDTLVNGVLPFTRNLPFAATGTGIFKFQENGFRLVALLPLQRRVAIDLYRVA